MAVLGSCARTNKLLQPNNGNSERAFFLPVSFAKAQAVWCNSYNFLDKEVGPGFRVIGPEPYV